ncbi:hypothetical protein Ait01nite_092440 [Actinoplanes italicus]|uniref:Uncharacterized protein n=1 Tax=Actinoplanes italicus TaxID=113567 RepID=A0A2T0K2P4_9ACTN|nr:hypothetical protein [Actinoplanes italicus]PRX17068.1 hypothetical protein CLV67_117125 [Actinoplanes italicus]GIE36199.1 hypothetical protein Ait01nite_092440 [Actinoplanes italicus]
MGPCHPDFTALAAGIDCATANPIVTVRDPSTLAGWTQPVLELLVVAGAIAALIHAMHRKRRGDASNLGLWFATVVYVLILEPPLYFPDLFGLDEQVGLIFVHNVFTVQFLYDRLPLYIVAIYPAITCLAYAIVQRTGILERRNPLVGAACVAVVFHAGYEVFDQLGPGLHWWVWNPEAPSNMPMIGDAPLTSAVIFAAAAPFGTVLLTRLLLSRGPYPIGAFVRRTAAVGILTPLAMMIFSAPAAPFGPAGRSVVLWTELAVLAVVAVSAFRRPSGGGDRYPLIAGAVYLAVMALLWTAGNAPPAAMIYAAAGALGWTIALVVSSADSRRMRTGSHPVTSC